MAVVRPPLVLPLAALLVLAGAPAGRAADPSPEETVYDAAITAWHREWAARPAVRPVSGLLDHPVCIRYWQTGDAIRARMRGAVVPASRTAYHTALLAYVDAALVAADECLAQSRLTPDWVTKTREAYELRRVLMKLVRASRLRLPTTWN
jgi:hypothetical protein